MLAAEFARFAGLPASSRQNQAEITNAVCDVMPRPRADLVLIDFTDEIHNLNLATRAGADASDQLKYLAERIPATFIYAGVDVEGSGLLAGTRGRQIAGQFGVITCQAFAYGTAAQRQEWQALIATLEQSLRLHRAEPFADGGHRGARVGQPALGDRTVAGQGRRDQPGAFAIGIVAEHARDRGCMRRPRSSGPPRRPGPAGNRQVPI